MQFAENLSGRQAADAVRGRSDWKYPLGLELTDPGVAAIRELNRLELVGETMRYALNSLAVVVPDWLRDQVPTGWL